MSGERYDQAIVQEIEAELRQALAVEPSPEFASRVRARIDQRSHTILWRFALAAAAVCIIAAGAVWVVRSDPMEVRLKPDAAPVTTEVRLKPDAAPVTTEVRLKPDATPTAVPSRGAAAPVVSGFSRTEPEVIVPPDRARALARLLELVRSGALDEESIRPVRSAAPPGLLEVAPIVIPSISLSDVEIQSAATPRGGADRQ